MSKRSFVVDVFILTGTVSLRKTIDIFENLNVMCLPLSPLLGWSNRQCYKLPPAKPLSKNLLLFLALDLINIKKKTL